MSVDIIKQKSSGRISLTLFHIEIMFYNSFALNLLKKSQTTEFDKNDTMIFYTH